MGNEEESNLLPTPANISSCQQTIPYIRVGPQVIHMIKLDYIYTPFFI